MLKGFQLVAGFKNTPDCWKRRNIDVKAPVGPDLCVKTGVGQPRDISMAENSGALVTGKQLFDRRHRCYGPMAEPFALCGFVRPELTCEPAKDAKIVEGVDLTGNCIGNRADACAIKWRRWQDGSGPG